MSNYVDYKCTIWGRLHFKDDTDMSVIIKKLEEDSSVSDISDPLLDFVDFEFLIETEEYITPSENDNQSTIEVYSGESTFQKCIWDNAIKQKEENDLETNN